MGVKDGVNPPDFEWESRAAALQHSVTSAIVRNVQLFPRSRLRRYLASAAAILGIGVACAVWALREDFDASDTLDARDQAHALASELEHNYHPVRYRLVHGIASMPPWLLRLSHLDTWAKEKEYHAYWVDARSRQETLDLVAGLRGEAEPAIPILRKLLDDPMNGGSSWNAARALNAMGAASWPVVRRAMESGSVSARGALLHCISWRLIASPHPEVAYPLRGYRFGGVESFPTTSPRYAETEGMVQLVMQATRDRNTNIRSLAVRELGALRIMLGPRADLEAALPAIVERLNDPDRGIRITAAYALAGYRKAAKASAVPILEKMKESSDLEIRVAGYHALEGYPGDAYEYLSPLIFRGE